MITVLKTVWSRFRQQNHITRCEKLDMRWEISCIARLCLTDFGFIDGGAKSQSHNLKISNLPL